MYRIFLCIIVLVSTLNIGGVFAATDGCETLKTSELPTNTELTTAVKRCIMARAGEDGETPNGIEEYVCPQGEMYMNNQIINDETLAYLNAVSLSLNKADIEIKKYMQELQKKRDPDPIKWINTINSCQEKIASIYANICMFGTIESRLNESEEKYIKTTLAYPQNLCVVLSSKKLEGWRYLQKIIMSDSISKNHKNSTDVWTTEVKGAYARVLASWQRYQRILARSVSKMTGFIKESN